MADETPTLDLAELERLEKAATPGPWKWSYQFLSLDAGKEKIIWPSNAQFDPENAREGLGACGKQAEPDAEANAALIAALRNAAPALIAAAKDRDELRAERDAANERAEAYFMQAIARLKAQDAELASLRALLIRAGSAMKPMSAMLCLVDDKDPSKGRAFDRFADDAVLFNVGKDRTITAGDLRRAFKISAALDARISALTTDTTDAGERDA